MGTSKTTLAVTVLNIDFVTALAQGWHCDDSYANEEEAVANAALLQTDTQDVRLIKGQAFGLALWTIGTRDI